MDFIYIRKLQLSVFLGIYAEEQTAPRQVGGPIMVSRGDFRFQKDFRFQSSEIRNVKFEIP